MTLIKLNYDEKLSLFFGIAKFISKNQHEVCEAPISQNVGETHLWGCAKAEPAHVQW
jgi:hypothetical protein